MKPGTSNPRGADGEKAKAPMRGDRARDVAFWRLAHLADRFPDLPIGAIDTRGLKERDAAFVHAIVDAAVGRWLTLVGVLDGCLKKPFAELESPLKGVLLGGAAQLLLLDRVPVHAAIDTAVEWAKHAIRPGAGSLVNAVLRQVAELIGERRAGPWRGDRASVPLTDGRVLAFKQPVLAEEVAALWSQATSCPETLLKRWSKEFGEDAAHALALHSLSDSPTILNMAYAGGEPIDQAGIELLQHDQAMHWVAKDATREQLANLLGKRRDVWVQDPASTRSLLGVGELAAKLGFKPRQIVDLCAGQGTKTRQLLSEFPTARIVASDTDARRLGVLRQEFGGEARVRVLDPGALYRECAETFDLALLDVPCSNSGVLARRLEARYRIDEGQMKRLTSLQRQIVGDSLRLLRRAPGEAWIIYSTCSLEAEENTDQARALEQVGFEIVRSERVMPQGVPGEAPTRYRDGSYCAVLRRRR